MGVVAWMKSPIGLLKLTCSDRALTGIAFIKEDALDQFVSVERSNSAILRQARMEILQWCRGARQQFDVPFEFDGTPFQNQVWLALSDLPYGQTISYSNLAMSIGRSDAVRAVANAVGQNPLPIIVPCHRVIESSGGIGGFLGGVQVKQQMLDLEKTIAKPVNQVSAATVAELA